MLYPDGYGETVNETARYRFPKLLRGTNSNAISTAMEPIPMAVCAAVCATAWLAAIRNQLWAGGTVGDQLASICDGTGE